MLEKPEYKVAASPEDQEKIKHITERFKKRLEQNTIPIVDIEHEIYTGPKTKVPYLRTKAEGEKTIVSLDTDSYYTCKNNEQKTKEKLTK